MNIDDKFYASLNWMEGGGKEASELSNSFVSAALSSLNCCILISLFALNSIGILNGCCCHHFIT